MGVGNLDRCWVGGVTLVGVALLAGCSDGGPDAGAAGNPPGAVIPASIRSTTVAAARSDLPRFRGAIALLDANLQAQAAQVLEPEADADYQGIGPAALPESSRRIDRTSPERLLDGALAALAARDVAALARLSVDRARLTEDDAAAAQRRFLSSSVQPYWKRVRQAIAAGDMTVTADGDRAYVDLEVGGAVGRYRIKLQRRSGGWYLAD